MARLEDPAPRPLADALEQDVAPQDEGLLAPQQPTGLELSDHPFVNELVRQGQGITKVRPTTVSILHRPPFRIGEDPRTFEGAEEMVAITASGRAGAPAG